MPAISGAAVSSRDLEVEIQSVNDTMADITALIAAKNFDAAKTAVDNAVTAFKEKASNSYFYYSVLDVKRNEDIHYTPPSINCFPSALDSHGYAQVQRQIAEAYHDIRAKLTDAETLLGQKKYKAALSICIEAFNTGKKIKDLIESAGDPVEIVQLPKSLNDMVADSKTAAQQIKSHFDAITSEKEKIRQIHITRDHLVQIMYAVRAIQLFVVHNRLDIGELEYYHTVCRRQLAAAALVKIKPPGIMSDFPAASYADALDSLLEKFRQEIITQGEYLQARNKTINEAVEHYNSISDPSDSASESYSTFSEDYLTEAVGHDTSDYGGFVIYTFDETALSDWLGVQDQKNIYRTQWTSTTNALLDAIHAADFLLESAPVYGKPIALTPVDIASEYGAFITDEDYRSAYAMPGYVFSGDDVDICNQADGPLVVGSATDLYFYGSTVSLYDYGTFLKSDWITTAGEYCDRLTERAGILFRAVMQGKRNAPRQYNAYGDYWDNVDNFVYGLMLYDRDKILDFRSNIKAIDDELEKFPSDWLQMAQTAFGGGTPVSQKLTELEGLVATINGFVSQPYVSRSDFEDLEITIDPVNQWKADAFLDGILVKTPEQLGSTGRIRFSDTSIVTTQINEIIDYADAAVSDIQAKAALAENTVDDYFQQLSGMIDFNDDLATSSLANTVSRLQEIQNTKNYRFKLENLLSGVENFQLQMRAGMDLSNTWNLLNGYLETFDRAFDAGGSGELGSTLTELNTYLAEIRDGAGYYPQYSLFTGTNLVMEPDNRDLVDSIEAVCWPLPNKGSYGRQHPLLLNYLSAEQIAMDLPNLRALLAAYRPDAPSPGHFIIMGTRGNDQDSVPSRRLPEKIGVKIFDVNHKCPAVGAWVAFSFYYNHTPGSRLEAVRSDQAIQDINGVFYILTDVKGEAEIYWYVGNDDAGMGRWGLRATVTSQADPDGAVFDFNAGNLDSRPEADQNANAIPDAWEAAYAVNGVPLSGALLDVDFDGDGLTSEDEYRDGTSPLNADTDGDGLTDGVDPDPQAAFASSVAGDLDNDWDVSLKDAIIALQVVAGMLPENTFKSANDIGNNAKIRLEEAVYDLMRSSE